MKKVINTATVIIITLLLSSCHRKLKIGAYATYVQAAENGLKKDADIDVWKYTMQYRPYDYIMLQESRGDMVHYDAAKRLKELAGTAWFNISLRLKDGTISPLLYNLSSREEYDTRLNYLLNSAQHDICLLYGQDTLLPVSYAFENNYNLTPQETMIVGFMLPERDKQPVKDMQLSYNDKVYKNGIVKAKFKSEDLKRIPDLIY